MKKQAGVIDLSMALIVAALVVLALLVGLVQQNRISKLRAQHATTLAGIAQKASDAQKALATYRAAVDNFNRTSTSLVATIEGTSHATIENLRSLAAAERANRLRDNRSYTQRAQHLQSLALHATTDAERQASAAAIGVLADMHASLDDRAGQVAAYADESRARGLACEAQYTTLADRINTGGPKE